MGRAYLEWKVGWFGRALKHHPDVWFADEMRFSRALDRYLLGDKDGCRVELEQLGAKGKPYVAEKAKELLAAMRAKGMLEEGS